MREEDIGSEGCEEFGVGMVNVGEAGTEEGEDRTDVGEERMSDEKLAAGEVIRGIWEDWWGKKGNVVD